MSTVQAVFVQGVFRPLGEVCIPEGTSVEVIIPPTHQESEPTTEQLAARDRIYELLSLRFDSDEPTNILETHNDHQP